MPNITGILEHAKSTKSYRDRQRICAVTQLLDSSVQSSPPASISLKIAQFFLSGQAFFKPKLKPIEHAAHAIQAITSLAQAITLSIVFFHKQDCEAEQDIYCLWVNFFNFIYIATLLVGWVPAEIHKEAYGQPVSPTEASSVNSQQVASPTLSHQPNSSAEDLSEEVDSARTYAFDIL